MIARRRGWNAPAPLVALARRAMSRPDLTSIMLEDWTTTLLGDRPLGPAPAATSPCGSEPPSGPDGNAEASIRCLVAVGDMDVAGSSQVAALLARRLPEHEVATSLAYTVDPERLPDDRESRLADLLRDEGIAVTETPDRDAAEELLLDLRPDVIHANGASKWWTELAEAHAIPIVETVHMLSHLFTDDVDGELERSRRLAQVIHVSDLARRQYLIKNPVIDPERVIAIPNGIDTFQHRRVDRDAARDWLGLSDEFLFVSLARMTVCKNPYGLIDAFAEVAGRHPEAHLLIAGRLDDRWYGQQVLELRDRLGLRGRVHIRDHTPSPPAVLAAADGFVLDAFFEAGPLCSMEAIYAGVPVLLSDVGNARDQIENDIPCGELVGSPMGDPGIDMWSAMHPFVYARQPNRAQLIDAMCRMIEERDAWRARRGEIAASGAARFDSRAAVARHAEVVRSCVLPALASV